MGGTTPKSDLDVAKDATGLSTVFVNAFPKFGDTSQDVYRLQARLNEISGSRLGLDGNFGPKTKAAVIAYQTLNGLKPDGIVGPKTGAALVMAVLTSTKPQAPAPKPETPPATAAKTGKLALVVGHERLKEGAWAGSPINAGEWVWNSDLAKRTQAFAKARGHGCEIFFRDGVGVSGAYSKAVAYGPNAIVELHFNSATPAAYGTETLFIDTNDATGVRELAFAQATQDAMCKALGRTGKGNRGLKELGEHDKRGLYNITRTSKIPSILIEPFFGSNPDECKLAHERKQAIAESLVLAFEAWLKG